MPRTRRIAVAAALAPLMFLHLHAPAAHAFKIKWKPVEPALLAESAGQVDPQAGAEAIFWEIHVTDKFEGNAPSSETLFYLRIKIYNERGRDSQAKVEIPYGENERIVDIAGRTIRRDGSTVELKKDGIFDRTVIKASRVKGKAKSFAMPAVETGCVIEYQWTASRHRALADNLILPAQRDIPIRVLSFHLRPLVLEGWNYKMRVRTFNGTFPVPVEGPDRTRVIKVERINALGEEPYMPPSGQVLMWLLLDYTDGSEPPKDRYWADHAKRRAKDYLDSTRPGPEVRRLADSLTAGVADFVRKVEALHDYCRARIRNVDDDANGYTDDFRDTFLKTDRTPEKTARNRMGSGRDIDMLFAALASAAGFDARVALVGDRSEAFFDRDRLMAEFLTDFVIAVRVTGAWRFYDPALRYVPAGMLPWWEEGQDALILDPIQAEFVATPISPPTASLRRRSARLRLGDDGTLEGDVRIELTGHAAARGKEDLDEYSPEKREEEIRSEIRKQWPAAQVSHLRIEGVTDPALPLSYAYHVVLPGYAERAGERILLQPAMFQYGTTPMFPASSRRYAMYFAYPWSEEDSVTIELPAGYALDASAEPEPVVSGRTLSHRITIESPGAHSLLLHRRMEFGADGTLLIPASEYGKVKRFFDKIHERDGHMTTLSRAHEG